MANVRLTSLVESVSGTSGEIVYKTRGGKVYMSRRPDFSARVLSPAQEGWLNRFRSAVGFARDVMADPEARKPFEQAAKKEGRTVYNTIIGFYLNREGSTAYTQRFE